MTMFQSFDSKSSPEIHPPRLADLRRELARRDLVERQAQHERRHQAGDALAGAELPPGMTRSRADAGQWRGQR